MVVEFQDDAAHTIQEIAVVSHHEQRLVAPREESFEPFYHLQVEMVGRLVEYQQVGFQYEHVSQCHALLLSSAQLPHGLLQVANLQLGQDLLGLEHPLRVALMVETSIEHALIGVECGCLFQEPHLEVALEDDGAIVVAFLACQYREQRRLSRAVLGYQPHLLSFGNGETDTLEQHQRPERFRQVLNVEVWNFLGHVDEAFGPPTAAPAIC